MKTFLLWGFVVFVWLSMGVSCLHSQQQRMGTLFKMFGKKVKRLTPPSQPNTGGTGFIVQAPSGKSYILTNAHVCAINENGLIRVGDDERGYVVRVIEVSKISDLCLLESINNQPGLLVAKSVALGDDIYIIGYPYGEKNIADGNMVEFKDIELLTELPIEKCDGHNLRIIKIDGLFGEIQVCLKSFFSSVLSAHIYPGNSGSPILNNDGGVVGVVFAGDNRTNYGAGVPLEDVQDFLKDY